MTSHPVAALSFSFTPACLNEKSLTFQCQRQHSVFHTAPPKSVTPTAGRVYANDKGVVMLITVS